MPSSSARPATRSSVCRRSAPSRERPSHGRCCGLTVGARWRDNRFSMPLIETEEAARRLARAIASDVSLYNEEKIVRGIEHDSLFDELGEEIEEGRALYKSRVSPELYHRNFYDRALVDILIKSKGHVKSRIW